MSEGHMNVTTYRLDRSKTISKYTEFPVEISLVALYQVEENVSLPT